MSTKFVYISAVCLHLSADLTEFVYFFQQQLATLQHNVAQLQSLEQHILAQQNSSQNQQHQLQQKVQQILQQKQQLQQQIKQFQQQVSLVTFLFTYQLFVYIYSNFIGGTTIGLHSTCYTIKHATPIIFSGSNRYFNLNERFLTYFSVKSTFFC